MNRRGFLSLLGGLSATAVLDPEKLLWVPGAKTISIPKRNSGIYGLRYLLVGGNAGSLMGIQRSAYPGKFSTPTRRTPHPNPRPPIGGNFILSAAK